jgi:hypothetical protein
LEASTSAILTTINPTWTTSDESQSNTKDMTQSELQSRSHIPSSEDAGWGKLPGALILDRSLASASVTT